MKAGLVIRITSMALSLSRSVRYPLAHGNGVIMWLNLVAKTLP